MNIVVLTSSMADADFNEFAKSARIKPNPSNQNFYNKLIKALSFYNNVSVLSLRPFVKGMFDDDYLDSRDGNDGTIKYYYPYIKASKSFKVSKQTEEILGTFERLIVEQGYKSFVLVVDTLRYSLLKATKEIVKKYGCKVIGVVTDNPSNISGARPSYIASIKRLTNNFDGYISLTESLNRVINIKKKPSIVTEGLVEDIEESPKLPIGEYLFFGGALSDRFGVRRMLDAFHKSNSKYKLVIAGSGELTKYIYDLSDKDRRILFLGLLDKSTLYMLEQHAVMNINPRPYDWRMDRESVPSKLLEYFASGAPVMSTKHSKTQEIFYNSAIWLEDDSEKGLQRAIESLDHQDFVELKKRAINARLRVYELYGLRSQGESFTHFIASINSSSIK